MKSIIVVEDDDSVGATIRAVLEESSYRVQVFATAREVPLGSAPALVITDLTGRSGYSSGGAISDVRAVRVRAAAPILVLTAHGAAQSDVALGHEASAVMTKPFEIDDLVAVVERLAV